MHYELSDSFRANQPYTNTSVAHNYNHGDMAIYECYDDFIFGLVKKILLKVRSLSNQRSSTKVRLFLIHSSFFPQLLPPSLTKKINSPPSPETSASNSPAPTVLKSAQMTTLTPPKVAADSPKPTSTWLLGKTTPIGSPLKTTRSSHTAKMVFGSLHLMNVFVLMKLRGGERLCHLIVI